MRRHSSAFTRVELLAVVVALALLGALALPLLAGSRSNSQRAVCINNLRLVGAGLHAWAMSHNEKLPWQVFSSGGGVNNLDGAYPLVVNPFLHFAPASNEMVTPQIFACPSDTAKKVAKDFSSSPDGGLFHINYRNNAQSYFIGLDTYLEAPRGMLSGDRNIRFSRSKTCGAVNVPCSTLDGLDPGVAFTNGVHRFSGQILLVDGSVASGDSAMLGRLALNSQDPIDANSIGGAAPNNDTLFPSQPTVIVDQP